MRKEWLNFSRRAAVVTYDVDRALTVHLQLVETVLVASAGIIRPLAAGCLSCEGLTGDHAIEKRRLAKKVNDHEIGYWSTDGIGGGSNPRPPRIS